MSLRRAIRTVLPSLLALVLAGSVGLGVSPASAGTLEDEQLFVQLINQTRAQAGLEPLIIDPELTAQARIWASSMAAADQLAHSPDITTGITAPWTVLGENVGVHAVHEPGQLYDAFVASPSHYQNLVDPRFRYVGVGVVNTPEGKIWTTHRFMATSEPATTTPPTTATQPTKAPATTKAPVTTNAPLTTRAPPTTKPPTSTPTSIKASPTTRAPGATTATPPITGASTSTTVGTADTAGPTRRPSPVPGGDPPDLQPAVDDDSTGGTAPDGQPRQDPTEPPTVGPGLPDLTTVEDMLLGLIEAGI